MVETESSREACSIALTETDRRDGAEDLLERILDRNNLNKAYLKVKRNGGSAGVDEMTVDGMLPYLKEHREELLTALRNGWYKPQAVRRVDRCSPTAAMDFARSAVPIRQSVRRWNTMNRVTAM